MTNKVEVTEKYLEAKAVNVKPKIAIPLCELIERVNSEPKQPMVWSGIKENSIGIIAGPSKSCKTILCENLGLSIASGATSFLGLPLEIRNRKVLFISCEEFYKNRTERNSKQISKLKCYGEAHWKNNYIVVNEHIPRNVNTEEEWKIISDIIKESKPGIVFIDSITRLYQGAIEDSKVAKILMDKLREMANNLEITLVAIHHTHKIFNQPISIHSIAGSRILSQEADFIIGMNRTLDNQRYIKNLAFRYADDADDEVTLFNLTEDLWINVLKKETESSLLSASDGRRDYSNTNTVKAFISENKEIVSFNDLKQKFIQTKMMSKQTLFNQIGKLTEEGIIEKAAKGAYRLASKSITEEEE